MPYITLGHTAVNMALSTIKIPKRKAAGRNDFHMHSVLEMPSSEQATEKEASFSH